MGKIKKERSRQVKKRNDLLLLLSLLLVAGLSFLIVKLNHKDGRSVQIILDDQIIYDLPLDQDAFKIIRRGKQWNKIRIRDGRVYVDEANCRNQLCVRHAKIQYAGQSIVCLPHHLIIQISGEKEESNPVDAFSY